MMSKVWQGLLEEVTVKSLVNIFELVPDILFWIKNTKGQIIYANKVYIEHIKQKSLKDVQGKTDKDFFPPHLAQQYMLDDEKLLTGDLITDRLEMNISNTGEFAWFSTSKRPLHNEKQEVIGSYGVTRHFQKSSQAISSIESLEAPINYIQHNYQNSISLDYLAELAHLSVSALERRFKKHLDTTPTKFINEIRLENARMLILENTTPIAEIAYQTGFSDHSYFTKQFKNFFGVHPSKMREQSKH